MSMRIRDVQVFDENGSFVKKDICVLGERIAENFDYERYEKGDGSSRSCQTKEL
ncbi:MAG: hypothetical protein LUG93_06155 [Lachnospiraceae bacterium]|nr:hypothetical protein [Lachnospiraceae bacterium]